MMVSTTLLVNVVICSITVAQLLVPFAAPHQQSMAGIQVPEPSSDQPPSGRPTGDVILSDILGNQKRINIFAGFTRDISSVSDRLDSESLNTTVLAPLNTAISALPRKPWEDPNDYAMLGIQAYDGKDGEDRAHWNLRRFTEAHVVPASPWAESHKIKSMGGGSLWWEKKDGKTLIMPGNVEVEGVLHTVANGEVWVLRGVINYA